MEKMLLLLASGPRGQLLGMWPVCTVIWYVPGNLRGRHYKAKVIGQISGHIINLARLMLTAFTVE